MTKTAVGERHCINHKDRPAIGMCHQCHKPICEACRYAEPAEGLFCSQACYDQYLAYQGRKQKPLRGSPLRSLAIGLTLLIVVAAAALFVGGRMLRLPFLAPLYDSLARLIPMLR